MAKICKNCGAEYTSQGGSYCSRYCSSAGSRSLDGDITTYIKDALEKNTPRQAIVAKVRELSAKRLSTATIVKIVLRAEAAMGRQIQPPPEDDVQATPQQMCVTLHPVRLPAPWPTMESDARAFSAVLATWERRKAKGCVKS